MRHTRGQQHTLKTHPSRETLLTIIEGIWVATGDVVVEVMVVVDEVVGWCSMPANTLFGLCIAQSLVVFYAHQPFV